MYKMKQLVSPRILTGTSNGSATDTRYLPDNKVLMVEIGTMSGSTPAYQPILQESKDGSNWSAVADVPSPVMAANDDRLCVAFTHRFRYLRLRGVVTGGTPQIPVAAQVLATDGQFTDQ
jgi:hypothetical protein